MLEYGIILYIKSRIKVKGCDNMQREITVKEVEKTLNEDNINDTIIVKRKDKSDVIIMNLEEYERILEMKLIKKLKEGEKQIKNKEVIDADIVFNEMRTKYGY